MGRTQEWVARRERQVRAVVNLIGADRLLREALAPFALAGEVIVDRGPGADRTHIHLVARRGCDGLTDAVAVHDDEAATADDLVGLLRVRVGQGIAGFAKNVAEYLAAKEKQDDPDA